MTYLSVMFSQSSSSLLSLNTVAIVVGTVHGEEMASHKGSGQTSSKSEPEPSWPGVSARLAHAVSGPHAAPSHGESVCWVCGRSDSFHYVSCRFGLVDAALC